MIKVYQRDAIEALLDYQHDLLADRQDLVIRDSGIWVVAPHRWTKGVRLMPKEIDALLEHPHRDLSRPALPFPFTMDDFLQFEECCCLFRERYQLLPRGEFDRDALAEVEARSIPAGELLRALFDVERTAPARHVQATERYAQAILSAIYKLGLDPMALPWRRRGPLPGIKSKIFELVRSENPSFTPANLKAGWERLSSGKKEGKNRIAEESEEEARCRRDRTGGQAINLAPKEPDR
jgi:hypothetical protein